MSNFSWRRWCSSLFSRRIRRPFVSRATKRNRLSFHPLEERTTPSLTPLKLADVATYTLSNPAYVETIGSTFYFVGYDSEHGTELWKSDGTASGTTIVKDIYPGTYSTYPGYPEVAKNSYPDELVNLNGTLYFTARDSGFGRGLLKSDGTEAGTVKVADLWQGSGLTVVNETIFFVGYTNETGSELWKSDGTAAGTTLVKDIYPGTHIEYNCGYYICVPYEVPNSSFPQNMTELNGILYFTATDSSNRASLWMSDGTPDGTVQVKNIGAQNLEKVNQTLFLSGNDASLVYDPNDASLGYELWKSDGTESGTTLVRDINTGKNWSSPTNLTEINGTLFFMALSDVGSELWKSDGTTSGTSLVKDITPGIEGTWIHGITELNGQAYFMARDVTSGWWLWKSDGTPSGTVQVKDIPSVDWLAPSQLTAVNGVLFFASYDLDAGYQLWMSDGTAAGTIQVSEQSNVGSLANFAGQLMYTATAEQTSLWTLTEEALPTASLSIGDASVSEGNSGTRTMTFTVTLSMPSVDTVTVNYSTANDTALAGSDFIEASGMLTFLPGDTSKTISVTVLGDSTAEPDETFFVQLSGWTNAIVSDSRAMGTILDDDPYVMISPASVVEGNSGTTTMQFTVTLTKPSSFPVSVNFNTENGSALAGSDYTATSGTLTFSPGETSKTISVFVHGDRVAESQETFAVILSGATNATIDGSYADGIIQDDEPWINISNVSRNEGKKGKTLFVFTVTLSTAYDQAVTMSYRTVDGTATTGNRDYTAKSGTVTFSPGQTTKTITIEVVGDRNRETDEVFYLDLFNNSSNSALSVNRGEGWILNDDSGGGKRGRR